MPFCPNEVLFAVDFVNGFGAICTFFSALAATMSSGFAALSEFITVLRR